jgi:hypothetical protein
MKKLLLLVLVFTYGCFSQNLKVNKIEPPNWWAGMKKNKIQLMIYGKNLFNYGVSFNTNQIKIDSIYTLENSDYSRGKTR